MPISSAQEATGSSRRQAAGQNPELGGLQLQDHGARDARFFPRGIPDFFGETADRVFGFFEGDVALESILGGDGFGGAVGNDFAVVDAEGELVQPMAVTAEVAFDELISMVRRSPTVRMPRLASRSAVTLPTPGRRSTGSGGRKALTSSGWITKRPSGLRQSEAIFARNLLGATPADAVRCSSSRMAWRMALATLVAWADRLCSRSHQGRLRRVRAAR